MLSGSMKRKILLALKEDISAGDVTSALVKPKQCTAEIKAKSNGILAGMKEAIYLFNSRGVKAKVFACDGEKISKGKKILELHGINKKILECERTALNFLGRMSGVALTAVQAKQIAFPVPVAATRKTIPLFNEFDKKACETAGIIPHRKNLNEMVLLKENHLKFFSNPFEAVMAAKQKYKRKKIKINGKMQKMKIEIEVTGLAEALSAAKAKPDIIMLDNFSLKQAKKGIQLIRSLSPKTKIELSGGINLKNLRKYSLLKPEFISLGEITKNAKQADYSLKII